MGGGGGARVARGDMDKALLRTQAAATSLQHSSAASLQPVRCCKTGPGARKKGSANRAALGLACHHPLHAHVVAAARIVMSGICQEGCKLLRT